MSHRNPVECSGLLTRLRLTQRPVTLTVVVSTRRQETFTSVSSQTFISFFKQPAAARPQGRGEFDTNGNVYFFPFTFLSIYENIFASIILNFDFEILDRLPVR